MANNPMRHTDPTGHTISDVEQGIEILNGLVDMLVKVGNAIEAAIPLLLMPFIGFALSLVFYILILTIVVLMFMVLAEIFSLLGDPFDHYQGERPNGDVASTDPGGLPQEPDQDCPIWSSGDLSEMLTGISRSDAIYGNLADCFDGSCILEAFTDNSSGTNGPQLGPILSGIVLGLDGSATILLLITLGLAVTLLDPAGVGVIVIAALLLSLASAAIVCNEVGWMTATCISGLLLVGASALLPVSPAGIVAGAGISTFSIVRDLANCW